MPTQPASLLFDLDGTLLDTALDLAAALNMLLQEENKQPLPIEQIRPSVSNGGNTLVALGFGTTPDDPRHQKLYSRLLDIYGDNLAVHTRPFPGIAELLETLAQRDIPWGVVTNKPGAYTRPLLEALSLQPAATVCPDDVKHRKPHPEPMLLACKIIGCSSLQSSYVGDHLRDIQAGRNAGMHTIAALYGYIEEGDNPQHWGADLHVQSATEITHWLTDTQA